MSARWYHFAAAGFGTSLVLANRYSHTKSDQLTLFLRYFSITLLAIATWSLCIYPRFISPLRHIPQARLGWRDRLYKWIYTEPDPNAVFDWLRRTPNNGLIRYPGIGGVERILIVSPAAIKEVLVTRAYGSFERPLLGRQRFAGLFGHGLLSAEGDVHKVAKRKMLAAFAPRHIRALYPLFWSKACEMIASLDEYIRNTSTTTGDEKTNNAPSAIVDIGLWTSRASLDIIGVAAWGKDFHALRDPRSDFIRAYHSIFRGSPKAQRQASVIYAAALAIPLSTLRRYFPCEFFDNLRNGHVAMRKRCQEAIAEKRAVMKTSEANVRAEKEKEEKKSGKDILSVAMATSVFEDEALVGQMTNILAAGHETTSTALVWTCYLLALHPKIQTRLREEVRSRLPSPIFDDNNPGTDSKIDIAEAIESLPYLHAICRESLRVIPVAPLVRREASTDTTILGQAIPKGTSVIAMAWAVNRLESEWGVDALEFRPERWLSEASTGEAANNGDATSTSAPNGTAKLTTMQNKATPYNYLSFSTGPRSCIGEGFAKAEFAALLAAVVGRFRIEPEVDTPEGRGRLPRIMWGITARPLGLRFRMAVLGGW